MRNTLIASDEELEEDRLEEESLIEAETLSNVIIDLGGFSIKLVVKRIDDLFEKNIWEWPRHESISKTFVVISSEGRDVGKNELQIFKNGFEKRIGQLHQWSNCYFTRDPIYLFTKQVSVVDKRQVCARPYYIYKTPNAVHSGLGQEAYSVVRNLIEKQHWAEVRWLV